MGEFKIRKFDTYILLEFDRDEYLDIGEIASRASQLAHDLQSLNGGKTVVARIGDAFTIILDGKTGSLNPDMIGSILS